ncbi:MAG TPA: hypothetical protein PK467_11250 [Candidatus Wallbacteria bacterium]|nr:hypothetical protein [Candidatus Wallbacteria bacterium]
MNCLYKKAFLFSMALSMIFTFAGVFQSPAAAEDKIKIEKTSEEISLQPVNDSIQPSTLEAEFERIIGRFCRDVVFEIETAAGDTGETINRSAKIMVKDTENVRIETSLPNGMQLVITSAAGDGWIYFPKTNMIMEIKPDGKKSSDAAGADFISDFLANRKDHVINKNSAGNSICYEIAEKNGGRVINYLFSKDELLEKIIINEKNKTSEEILIKKTSFGPIDESVFTRPKNAFKMPVNEFPDFDY